MSVTIKKKQLLLAIVLGACFLCWGCGVSKSDYADLESRVKKLEKEVYGETEPENQKDTSKKTTQTAKKETNGVYDLSDLSVDEIVTEFTRFLTPDMAGKKPEQFAKELNLRYYPNNIKDSSACFKGNSSQSFGYFEGEGDYLGSLSYSYKKNMDDTLEEATMVYLSFAIVDYHRAEEIFDRLVKCFFRYDEARKEGTTWQVWNNRTGSSLMMEKGGKAYTFAIQLYLSR